MLLKINLENGLQLKDIIFSFLKGKIREKQSKVSLMI